MGKQPGKETVVITLPPDVADKYEVAGEITGPIVQWRSAVDLRKISVETADALVADNFPHLKAKAAPVEKTPAAETATKKTGKTSKEEK